MDGKNISKPCPLPALNVSKITIIIITFSIGEAHWSYSGHTWRIGCSLLISTLLILSSFLSPTEFHRVKFWALCCFYCISMNNQHRWEQWTNCILSRMTQRCYLGGWVFGWWGLCSRQSLVQLKQTKAEWSENANYYLHLKQMVGQIRTDTLLVLPWILDWHGQLTRRLYKALLPDTHYASAEVVAGCGRHENGVFRLNAQRFILYIVW